MLYAQPSTLKPQPSLLNPEPWTLTHQAPVRHALPPGTTSHQPAGKGGPRAGGGGRGPPPPMEAPTGGGDWRCLTSLGDVEKLQATLDPHGAREHRLGEVPIPHHTFVSAHYRGTSLTRNTHPPEGDHRALGIVLL